MRAYDIILKKRIKQALSLEELKFMIQGNIDGQVPDYQMSAWLMAVYLNGMNTQEVKYYTEALVNSGKKIIFK